VRATRVSAKLGTADAAAVLAGGSVLLVPLPPGIVSAFVTGTGALRRGNRTGVIIITAPVNKSARKKRFSINGMQEG
jgi:hypothetical protein